MAELRALLLEDSATDAELMVMELERAGLAVDTLRVATRDDFARELGEFLPSIVLADFSLPSFDGSEALHWVSEHHPHLPVIIVTGALGDERAIELIKAGAFDYVLKSNLVRLGPAVLRAMAEARHVRARLEAERALADSELRYRRLFETARDSIIITDAGSGAVLDVNPFLEVLLGYPRSEYLGKVLWQAVPFRDVDEIKQAFAALQHDEYRHCEYMKLSSSNGTALEVEGACNVCMVGSQRVIQWNFRDVTETRHAEEKANREREKLMRSLELRIEERTAQLRAMAFELTQAEERERQAMARDLHDSLGQTLAIAKIKLGGVQLEVLPPELRKTLNSVLQLIDQSNQSVRSLATQLSLPVLYDLGLIPALEWLAEQMRRDFSLDCRIVTDGVPKSMDQSVCTIVFRAIRELLINVVKHAESVTGAEVVVSLLDSRATANGAAALRVVVKDAGKGFAPASAGGSLRGGFGLMSVRERLAHIGGTVDISSTPGAGTLVRLEVPLRDNIGNAGAL